MTNNDDDIYDEPICSQEANNLEHENAKTKENIGAAANMALLKQVESAASVGESLLDSVHKDLRLHPACTAFMKADEFARLGNLKQLGVAHNVFPAAHHTRKEHSIGVSHLAFKMVRGLLSRSREALRVTEREVRNIVLAGLCHDLGHGPLSHVFEKELLKRIMHKIKDKVEEHGLWEHEHMSVKMMERIRTQQGNNIPDFDESDIEFMCKLIQGQGRDQEQDSSRRWLYDIISNDHNGIDVDRMDYLQRDMAQSGAGPAACNLEQLLATAEVVDGQICYPLSQRFNVWAVFTERVRMFRDVYTHRGTKAAEFMAVEALVKADCALKFSERIWTAENFIHLDDSLLLSIQRFQVERPTDYAALDPAARADLDAAQALLARLRRRDLYRCCGLCEVPEALLLGTAWEGAADSLVHRFTAAEVAGEALPLPLPPGDGSSGSSSISAADLILDVNRIDYAKGGRDPMATVGFFEDESLTPEGRPRVKVVLRPEQLDELPNRPSCFKIRTLRVFVREEEHCAAAAAAFQRWCLKHLGPEARVVLTGDQVDGQAAHVVSAAASISTNTTMSDGAVATAAALRSEPLPEPAAPLHSALLKRHLSDRSGGANDQVGGGGDSGGDPVGADTPPGVEAGSRVGNPSKRMHAATSTC